MAEKQITMRELRQMLRAEEVDEAALRPYVELDEDRSNAFSPRLRVNRALVDDEGLEGDILLGGFNELSRKWRQTRYRLKTAFGWDGLRIVSEGDSWFQYPILLDDVIDQVFDRYAIFSLGAAGDLLADMVNEDELSDAIEAEEPDVFLISGGGNDLAGNERIATLLHPFESGRDPKDYPNAQFDAFLQDLSQLYRGLFTRLSVKFPGLKILCHGYDYAIPNNGKWLGKPMVRLRIRRKALQRDIMAVLIDRLNESLSRVAADFEGVVFYVDCRGAVPDDQWHDELHPTDQGFEAVAQRFQTVIDAVSRHSEVGDRGRLALSPGREHRVESARDLEPATFRRLVARRAREVAGVTVGAVDTEEQRRELEGHISQFFEKVHSGADFLPARFLTDGASRAAAVCRISTPTSRGTGFLIQSHQFIMTNNHVISDAETARQSMAEFGFEDGGNLIPVPLNPELLFITNQALDFTIIGCDGSALTDVIPVPLLRSPATVTRDERVNIIQHPQGREKEVALHNNTVTRVLDTVIRYRTDTEPGSSGSPVFNNTWQLTALHHAGWAEGDGKAVNEGIRIAAIVAHLVGLRQDGSHSSQALMDLLELVPDSSPLLGFFDIAGVESGDGLEAEIPDFAGSPDFADIGFWNIERFNRNVSETRVEQVADVLSKLSMDVMGLVEVNQEALDRLVSAMQRRGDAVAFELLNVSGSQDLAVLFDRETSEVELATDIADRHRDALAVTTPSGRKAFPREPLFARCKVLDGNDRAIEFIMIVVHFKAFGDAQSRARRRLAAQVLAEIIQDIRDTSGLPVVLGGDFNETLNTDVLSAFSDASDLFALTADDATAGAASYVGGTRRSLIDHILISRDIRPGVIAGDDAAIVRLDRSIRDFADNVSDHVPIVFRIVARDTPIDVGGSPGSDSGPTLPIPPGSSTVSLNFD